MHRIGHSSPPLKPDKNGSPRSERGVGLFIQKPTYVSQAHHQERSSWPVRRDAQLPEQQCRQNGNFLLSYQQGVWLDVVFYPKTDSQAPQVVIPA